jgi:hypothetical protein
VSWVLVVQLLILMVVAAVLVEAVGSAWMDKRRQDDLRRKEAGL